jgi:CHC2 zinc finger
VAEEEAVDEAFDEFFVLVGGGGLASAAGVELRRQGKDLVALCPFHEERTGSLVVSPERNLWHCMGACQAGGSVIDWVMRTEGVSFRHAVELLRDGLQDAASRQRVASGRRGGHWVMFFCFGHTAGELLVDPLLYDIAPSVFAE